VHVKHIDLVLAGALALVACNNGSTPADTGAGGNDAGNDAASSSMVDAGSDAFVAMADAGGECHDDYSGCTTLDDHTGDTGPVVIAATASFTYDHHCVRIHTGQVVTITNSITHPVVAAACSTAGSPIPASPMAATTPATTTDFTFTTAGHYGYFCANHGSDDGTAMAGLIVVE
jgi:plastocyanin